MLYSITNLLASLKYLVNYYVIPLLLGLAVAAFFWGLVKYIFSEEKEGGRNLMLGGIVALFIMVSLWGIITLIGSNLGVATNGSVLNPPIIGG